MSIAQSLGALGLFLLGMWLMTEGLKLAGGKALKQILQHWISTRWRGFVAGFALTGLVQSSSAITVATIGFVNARLMSFSQSVWVVFGSNLGTTMTAWIVTLVGFKLDINGLSLPLIGIGALMRVFLPQARAQALGMAIAGFGLLFMGIAYLQASFGQMNTFDLTIPFIDSPLLTGLLLGIVLTTVTQSSSAAIALVLTASTAGIGQLALMAGAVVGANIGTTTSALLAGIGATPAAKRVIAMHILFNLVTAVVALSVLVFLLPYAPVAWGEPATITVALSALHTAFNVLGVLLMVPLEPRLSGFLLKRFRKGRTANLIDSSLAVVPDIALDTARQHIDGLLRQVDEVSLASSIPTDRLRYINEQIDVLENFISLATKQKLTDDQADNIAVLLTSLIRLRDALESLQAHAQHLTSLKTPSAMLLNWLQSADELKQDDNNWSEIVSRYNQLKRALIRQDIQQPGGAFDVQLQCASLAMRFLRKRFEARTNLQTEQSGIAIQAGQQPSESPSLEAN